MKYLASGIREHWDEGLFWDFLEAYNGYGEFIPFEEGGSDGEFNVWFSSDKKVTLEQLKRQFYFLKINSLEELAA